MKVIILGAGASVSAGFPLGRNLTPLIRDGLPENRISDWDTLERRGIFDREDDFEINLTRLDIDILRRQQPGRTLAINAPDGPIWLPSFRGDLSKTLEAIMERRHAELLESPSDVDYLRQFVSRHVASGDVVVTFNYDCLIESVLQEAGLWTLADGYGFDLKSFFPDLHDEPTSPCLVLKLHGSIGWTTAVDVDNLLLVDQSILKYLGYSQPLRIRLSGTHGVDYTAVLPSFVKGLWRYPLPRLWRAAAQSIASASSVTIVGYSLPQADAAARTLCFTHVREGQRVTYYWHDDRELPNVNEIQAGFEVSRADVRNWKSSIEKLAESDEL